MKFEQYQTSLLDLCFGKRLPGAIYVYADRANLPVELVGLIEKITATLSLDEEYNLLKLSTNSYNISLLFYPTFFTEAHPSLAMSLAIDLASGKVKRTDYSTHKNPPILHRKEAFLPEDHPRRAEFARLTEQEVELGLFQQKTTMGFRLAWEKLLLEKGISFDGHTIVQGEPVVQVSTGAKVKIQRHRTAIARYDLSKPVKTLLEWDVLKPGLEVFDYGCGLGADIEGLSQLGYEVKGWDPVHRPDESKVEADIVNLGFVLNVIEDPSERVAVLSDAWKHARKLLVVSTMVAGQGNYLRTTEEYGDGVLTRRNTFQKYFQQGELQSFIEHVLHVDTVAVGLGIFYVFRDPIDLQDFVSRRSRREIDWSSISERLAFSYQRAGRKTVSAKLYEENRQVFDAFFKVAVQLGRCPLASEYEELGQILHLTGTPKRAIELLKTHIGEEVWAGAQDIRKNDTLVYLAMSNFGKNVQLKHLSSELQADIKEHFGSYTKGLAAGRDILFRVADEDAREAACAEASFGLNGERHFTFHSRMLEDLSPLLRILVQCAGQIYGDPYQADLIKIHKESRKVTFLIYDDFDKELPELTERHKVDLANLYLDSFDHANWHTHQLLYFKERYLSDNVENREQMEKFSMKLRKLGVVEDEGYGPTKEQFMKLLEERGLTMRLNQRRKKS